jgi:hypothetical protein
MRARFLPLLKVGLGVSVPLLLFRIALPWLIRLLVGAPVSPLAGVGFRRFFAHDFTSMKRKAPLAERVPHAGTNHHNGDA